jgi:DNA-binding GntR family transcriptional regulator
MQAVDLRSAKNTLSDLAYGHLLEAILSHELQPGTRLRPEDLAARMGLSPTPVKHALARLAGEGLVQHRAGLGPFVASLTVDEVADLYDCRLMCELHAIREGFYRIDDGFLSQLQRLLAAHATAFAARDGTYERQRLSIEADRDFHLCYMRLWPNERAVIWYGQLNVHIHSYQLTNNTAGRTEALVEHAAIATAFAARDLDGALAAVRGHLDAAKQSFLERARLGSSARTEAVRDARGERPGRR